MNRPITVLCLSSEIKGQAFLTACKRLGCQVFLLTEERLADADWPRQDLDELLLMPSLSEFEDVIRGVTYLARQHQIDLIIALDDYDVRLAAMLREHMRVPGMGSTTGRYFRDKLAMRFRAAEAGLAVPEFVHILNYDRLRSFMERVPPPWVFKPRFEAGSVGIQKAYTPEEVWQRVDTLGDNQSYYLLEAFVPGDVFHVDAIISEREVVFAQVHQYGRPPMSVSHEGGVFITRTLDHDGEEAQALQALNRELMAALGMVRGVTHTEFIRRPSDGRFYFLETAARVGGAHIAETIEAASGLNMWAEWARLEIAQVSGQTYELPSFRRDYAGILICLARQEWPDMSAYTEPEIVWRVHKQHHAGLIVTSPDAGRVEQLLADYNQRFAADFLAVGQPKQAKRTA